MSHPSQTSDPMANLISTLDLEKLEENLFRGESPQIGWQRVFGGRHRAGIDRSSTNRG